MNSLGWILWPAAIVFIIVISGALLPDPECAKGYIYIWRAHACLMGYKP